MDMDPHTTTTVLLEGQLLNKHKLNQIAYFLEYKYFTQPPSFCKEKEKIDTPDEAGQTLLHLAVEHGDLNLIKFLIDCEATINMPDKRMHTPFYIALVHKQFECAKLLLDYGADIHIPVQEHDISIEAMQTPLHAAAKAGNLEIAQFLIDHNAHINAQDSMDCPPLHFAIVHREPCMVKLLLQHGASTDLCDTQGYSTLDKAIFALNHSLDENECELSFNIITFLIEIGVQTIQGKEDFLDKITHPKHLSTLQQFRDTFFSMVRTKRCQQLLDMPNDAVRCFLHAYYKILAWHRYLISLHTTLQCAFSQISVQETRLKRIFQLEVQFRLIDYLENALEYYNPKEQLGSDKPIAFKSLISIQEFTHQIKLAYDVLLNRYHSCDALHFLSELQKKEIILNMLGLQAVETILADGFKRLMFFEYLSTYPLEEANQYFSKKWHDTLSKYLEKTLPKDLNKHWEAVYVYFASSIIGLNDFLKNGWLYNTFTESLSSFSDTKHNMTCNF